MAQSGYTPISIYYSSTATNVPTAGNLVNGELAINITDGKLFYKDNAGVVQTIAGKGGAGVAGGSNTQVQYNSSGSLAGSANMTFNGTGLTLANDASISGLTVGKGGGAVSSNAVLGSGAMAATATGGDSVAIGNSALAAMTSGSANVGIGSLALTANDTGANNVGVGVSSLRANTSGGSNTALGYQSLRFNSTASNNTAVGYQAGYSNTTGVDIVAIGYGALYSNSTGSYSTAVGYNALRNNTTGQNTAMGLQALQASTTGNSNDAFGIQALLSNTTGSYNVAIGDTSLGSNTTGSNNTGIGFQALNANTTASNNTAVGYQAGYSNTTATNNVFIGAQTGYANTTGTQNTYIGGYQAGYNITTGSFNSILGNYNGNSYGLDIRTASGYIVLSDGYGNPRQVIDSSGNVGIGTTSLTAKFTVAGPQYDNKNTANIFSYDTTAVAADIGGGLMMGGYYTGTTPTAWAAVSGLKNNATSGDYGGYLAFKTRANGSLLAEAMRIDSSGNVGIGTSSPSFSGSSRKALTLNAPTGQLSILELGVNGSLAGYLYSNSTQTTLTSATILTLETNGAERMRIDSSGRLLVGTTAQISGSTANLQVASGGTDVLVSYQNSATAANTCGAFWNNATSGNNVFFNFYTETSITARGSITYNRTAGLTSYNTTSDKRLKENIVDAPSALSKIDLVQIRSFDWKETGNKVDFGVIAQELEIVAPECVTQGQDNEDGTIKTPWAVDTSALVPALIKAIQELNAKVTALEAQLQGK